MKKYQRNSYLVTLFLLLFSLIGSAIAEDEFGYCSATVPLTGRVFKTRNVKVEVKWQADAATNTLKHSYFDGENYNLAPTYADVPGLPNHLILSYTNSSDANKGWSITVNRTPHGIAINNQGTMTFNIQDTYKTGSPWVTVTDAVATCFIATTADGLNRKRAAYCAVDACC